MSTDIRIRKGLDLKLVGDAENTISVVSRSQVYSLKPSDFHKVTPKLLLKEGVEVKAGEALFYAKDDQEVKFVSPVSGKIVEIKRGEKRVILEIRIQADVQDTFLEHGSKNPKDMSAEQVKAYLLGSGCWPFIKQRPYDVIANSNDTPKAIFISGFSSAPLSADVEVALRDRIVSFQAGIDALSKLTSGKIHLSLNQKGNSILNGISGVEIHQVSGPHPAGNVGVQISKVDPINIGERVWVIAPQDVAIIGDLFLTGRFDATRVIALTGSEVLKPQYYAVKIGAQMKEIVSGKLASENVRIISGDVLTGTKVGLDGNLGFYGNAVTVIPEGNYYRMFGWLPFSGLNKHSVQRTALSWLTPGKKYTADTNMNGEERAFVVTGEMEKLMPLDIFPMQLLKACMANDIEKMENLGIYEVAPEDFALIDYASTSKIEAQTIIREALDLMINEVG